MIKDKEAQRRYKREYMRIWSKTDRGKEAHRKTQRRYERKNLDISAAHTAVSRAIARGRLVRPGVCPECAQPGSVQAHHYLGYAKEHQLDVVWLCGPCHMKVHL
jgi:hypothetical protein